MHQQPEQAYTRCRTTPSTLGADLTLLWLALVAAINILRPVFTRYKKSERKSSRAPISTRTLQPAKPPEQDAICAYISVHDCRALGSDSERRQFGCDRVFVTFNANGPALTEKEYANFANTSSSPISISHIGICSSYNGGSMLAPNLVPLDQTYLGNPGNRLQISPGEITLDAEVVRQRAVAIRPQVSREYTVTI